MVLFGEDKASGNAWRCDMEFYENRSKRPFIGLVWLWQALRKWYDRERTRRVLDKMSDAQLKDVGLSRDDYR